MRSDPLESAPAAPVSRRQLREAEKARQAALDAAAAAAPVPTLAPEPSRVPRGAEPTARVREGAATAAPVATLAVPRGTTPDETRVLSRSTSPETTRVLHRGPGAPASDVRGSTAGTAGAAPQGPSRVASRARLRDAGAVDETRVVPRDGAATEPRPLRWTNVGGASAATRAGEAAAETRTASRAGTAGETRTATWSAGAGETRAARRAVADAPTEVSRPGAADETRIVRRGSAPEAPVAPQRGGALHEPRVAPRPPAVEETRVVPRARAVEETRVVARTPAVEENRVAPRTPDIDSTHVMTATPDVDSTHVLAPVADADTTHLIPATPGADTTHVIPAATDANAGHAADSRAVASRRAARASSGSTSPRVARSASSAPPKGIAHGPRGGTWAARTGVVAALLGVTVVVPVVENALPGGGDFGDPAVVEAQLPDTVEALTASSASGLPPASLVSADASPMRSDLTASRSEEREPLPGCDGATRAAGANGLLATGDLCTLWEGKTQLRADAAVSLAVLNQAFIARFGVDMCISSGYRTLAQQRSVKAQKGGLAAAPGKSNHGWGLAVDLCSSETTGAKWTWLNENAPSFGWDNPAWARPGGSGPYERWHWEYTKGVQEDGEFYG
ncbi:D-alanyl-D-alanine carboxypeptidase family protein [Cellulomonas sp. 179-A 4D5 NHS]|uniref:D-alanyl-D-alanine carboxypeptidase family protein n=1 Tax=Cellulomonas sp. 179-A 4D5 NHS TaxID=3142378 RepID=UPI0039A19125